MPDYPYMMLNNLFQANNNGGTGSMSAPEEMTENEIIWSAADPSNALIWGTADPMDFILHAAG